MKWLRRFNEGESWAGSVWAKKNPLVTNYSNSIEVKRKPIFNWKCQNCDVEFQSFSKEELTCQHCKSENIQSIPSSNFPI